MPYVEGQFEHGVFHVADVYHSGNVYANFVPIALYNDPQSPEAATMAEILSVNFAANAAVNVVDGEDDPSKVDLAMQAAVEDGTITQTEIDRGKNPIRGLSSSTIMNVVSATTTVTTFVSSSSVISDDFILYSTFNGIRTYTYTVASVTKQPGVVFPHALETSRGLSVTQLAANLELLLANCIHPIKMQYPKMFLTNTFRPAGTSSPTSQHPLAMACDMQWAGASKSDYYEFALWIRDNIPYDQLILEYKTTGSGSPWIHISLNIDNNRHMVMTFMNDKKYADGLVDLSAT